MIVSYKVVVAETVFEADALACSVFVVRNGDVVYEDEATTSDLAKTIGQKIVSDFNRRRQERDAK